MVGIAQHRSIQDEKLIEAIFQSHHSPSSRASNAPVYGATATNLIVDARPTANAMANTAKGAGTENMDHYKDGRKMYLGIDHIHVMRESLAKLVQALREADNVAVGMNGEPLEEITGLGILDRQALRRSGWLRHITAILEGSVIIARNVHVNSSHVLIHCSDGWDRTSQLAALSQLLLDPFYRTMRGFQILVEKDWLSFGYKFMDRCGHLSSEKFFVSPTDSPNVGGGADAAQAFLASVQNRFTSQHHIKETSPVFHQFLESVRQVQRQFPERFEFNERFLKQLYYHLYSCQFGTFLYNCERERRISERGPPPCDLTVSIWDFFNSPPEKEKNLNPSYDPTLDDPTRRAQGADMGVLFPNPKDVRFWYELYGRTDEEMNGRVIAAPLVKGVEYLSLDEGMDEDPVSGTSTPSSIPISISSSPIKSASPQSPSIATSSRELSSSLPDISRKKNVFQLSGSSSVTSLHTQGSPLSASSSQPASPNHHRLNKQADFLASSGMKSVWGKLSSNASAAFSVVQEAYEGVTRDLKGIGGGEEEDKTSELRDRETLPWGEDDRPVSREIGETYTIGSSSNPWASVKSRPSIVPSPFDNPWSSVKVPPPRQMISVGELFDDGPLPLDPTVLEPETVPNPKPTPVVEPSAPTSDISTDPLGVGPL